MIHSGSRNFGLKIANTYHKKAVALCEKWFSKLPDKDLSFLPFDEPEAIEYLDSMDFALAFAKKNRYLMIENIKTCFNSVISEIEYDETINIHHNYAKIENHFNSNVMVHRKGATSARLGEVGIIPGSQGTASYIVKGLGNPESFMSCSHGAGRKMGRKQAIRELNLNDEIEKLDSQGVIHSIRTVKDLDEAAGAYKDIDKVMENQKDLVKILVKLRPLAVIKG
jgi:tRNA-splicing ligase RtcB